MTIQAAAERLRRVHNGEDADKVYGQMVRLGLRDDPYVADMRNSLGEYLRLTDPTPLTQDLLNRLRFLYEGSSPAEKDSAVFSSWSYAGIRLRYYCDHWRIQSGEMWEYLPNPTLGAIRCIAFGMGITLPEQP